MRSAVKSRNPKMKAYQTFFLKSTERKSGKKAEIPSKNHISPKKNCARHNLCTAFCFAKSFQRLSDRGVNQKFSEVSAKARRRF
ncbi:MAG: hypothetical protein L6V93_10740 [Clostridiales bacterium]|nr:MAG: hypothetical protein L6V93_10740 [Clostridiales bacterium]